MGWADLLPGRRVEVLLLDPAGPRRWTRVRSGRIPRLRAKGWTVIPADRVPVFLLDAFHGPSETEWGVGVDVTADVVERLADPGTGALYAVVLYEGAEPRATKVTTRQRWEELRDSLPG